MRFFTVQLFDYPYAYKATGGASIEHFRFEREEEPIAASLLLDMDKNQWMHIYERQVEMAELQLNPIYDFILASEELTDRFNESLRINGANTLKICHELRVEIVDGAFLIAKKPLPYESYTKSVGKNHHLKSGVLQPDEVIRFDSMVVRPIYAEEGYVPEAEIEECVMVGEPEQKMAVYSRFVFNPREQAIAFMEIDTPRINVT